MFFIWIILIHEIKDTIYLEWSFREFSTWTFRFLLLIDFIALVFLRTVSLISFRVIVFRKSYITDETRRDRFYLILLIFIARIILLILSPNLVSCLLGWDGLGLSSYLLVIFYSNNKSYNSGIVTALTNRFGDILIIFRIAISIININWILRLATASRARKIWIWVLMVATFTKRAQIPFSSWLPAAMAAPTPVSSLVHSSTLVTAGIYLLIRFDSWFINWSSLRYLTLIGRATSLMAGLNALLETDLKKIVALSTLRQLGLMVWFLRIGLPKVSFIHLIAHAFFKAILFVGTGNIIHNANRGQDLRWIGGVRKFFSQTKRIVLLANFRLIGLPFMSAFFSKEILLENISLGFLGVFEFFIFYLRVILTLLYSIRFLVFYYSNTVKSQSLSLILDNDLLTIIRISLLAGPSLLGGKLFVNILFLTGTRISRIIIYNLVAWSLVFTLIIRSFLWIINKFLKDLRIAKAIISMWGLRLLTLCFGVTTTLHIPLTVIKKSDIGIQTLSVSRILSMNMFLFALRRLLKSLKIFLVIILIWGLVYINYYLNNKRLGFPLLKIR